MSSPVGAGSGLCSPSAKVALSISRSKSTGTKQIVVAEHLLTWRYPSCWCTSGKACSSERCAYTRTARVQQCNLPESSESIYTASTMRICNLLYKPQDKRRSTKWWEAPSYSSGTQQDYTRKITWNPSSLTSIYIRRKKVPFNKPFSFSYFKKIQPPSPDLIFRYVFTPLISTLHSTSELRIAISNFMHLPMQKKRYF